MLRMELGEWINLVTVFTSYILEDAPCLINIIEYIYKSHPLQGFIRSKEGWDIQEDLLSCSLH